MCKSTKIYILFFMLMSILFVPAGAFATLTSLTNSGGESAVYDDATNLYWFQSPGAFVNYSYYGGNYNQVINNINQVNSSSYYDISNWHLASQSEFSSMYAGSGYDQFTANFQPSNYSSGTKVIPGQPPICFPFVGCFGGTPDQYVNYTETKWSGILSDTTTLAYPVVIPDPNPFCGMYGFPPCQDTYQWLGDPGHVGINIGFVDYESNQTYYMDYTFAAWIETSDTGLVYSNYYSNASPIYGAWVVGTFGVPEPSSMLLFGSGLAGLYFARRKMK